LKINKSYDGALHFALHFAFFFTCKLVLFVALGMDFMLRGVEKCIPSGGEKISSSAGNLLYPNNFLQISEKI
jgi:hypothetical protein